jgi:aspartate/methionine/tyrosine aminotransferase
MRSSLLDENILDGVYFNRVYMDLIGPVPSHDVIVGSYSKLLGLNGIRVGWAATNADEYAQTLHGLAKAEYCGLSAASTQVLLQSLRGFNWDAFETTARAKLNSNRTEWEKLERFFGNARVNKNGMFYYGPIDSAAKSLLSRSGIHWTIGSQLGTDDSFGRFNLGQDCTLISEAVSMILKNDKIK